MVMVPTASCLFRLQKAEIQLLVQVLGKATSRDHLLDNAGVAK